MDKQIIQIGIEQIRNETKQGANTCERVATVLTNLNQNKLDSADIEDKLDRGNYQGTAEELKEAIDNITAILTSDDTSLDQLQEIVNYIKANKTILSQLGISNIAGLEKALKNKADKTHTHSYRDLEDKPTLFSGDYNDLVNKPNIQATIPTFSQIIDGGSTYLKSPISFLKKDNAEEEGADAGALGIDPKTFTFHFGKFNSSSTGLWGFQFGYGALENNTTGAENTAVGHYALHKNTTGSYNVAFGLNAGYANTDGSLNTFIGYNAGKNIIKGNTLTLVGANAGASLNNDRFNLKDLTDITPIIGKLIEKDKNYYKIALGYDEATQTITSGLSSFFGADSSKAGATRAVYSMVLGNNHLQGMSWRNYNNLIVSNGLIYKYSNVQVHNSLIWGNFMIISNADNILAIHNAKTDAVEFSDALIYGKFEERELKINGRFSFSTQYTPTQEHFTGQKLVVVDNLGQTSLIDPAGLISTPTNPVQWVTISAKKIKVVAGKSVYYPETIADTASDDLRELTMIEGGVAGNIIYIRATKNMKIIHDGNNIRLFEGKSITEGLDGNKVITFLCLAPNKWTEINRSWGYGQGAITTDFSSLIIGAVNLHKDTKVPNFTANDVGTGAKSVMTDATGIFARYTPANGKNVSLYGFRTEGSANGGFSRSVDVRHSHTSNITIWGKSIPPNQWFRLKDENFKSLNDWTLINVDTPNVSIDLRNFKVENGIKATDWNLHPEEAPNPFANTGLTESPLVGHILVMNPNTKEYFYKSLFKIIEQMDNETLKLLKQRLESI